MDGPGSKGPRHAIIATLSRQRRWTWWDALSEKFPERSRRASRNRLWRIGAVDAAWRRHCGMQSSLFLGCGDDACSLLAARARQFYSIADSHQKALPRKFVPTRSTPDA